MKNKTKKYQINIFRLVPICIGIIILSNPLVGLLDFFPDFLGYFLLIVGLDGVKRLNGDIEYGVKNLKLLCFISSVFFVLMFNTFKMDSSWNLTLTFSYMALSVILGLNACNSIFNGLDYCTDRHGSEGFPSVFEAKLMTKVYLFVKAVLVIVPELYAIVEVNAKEDFSPTSVYVSILSTERYVVAICFLLSFGIGAAWIAYIVKYAKAFKRDNILMSNLTKMYCDDFSSNGVPINFFNINFGSGLILISHIFIYDFVIDTVHFLPEFISVIMSGIGILILRKYLNCKGILKYGIVAFVFQILIYYYRYNYIENVIFETWDITSVHLVVSSLLALGYIVFTYMYFSKIHIASYEAYEKIFGWKSSEVYELGDTYFFIALIAAGGNIICSVWRPYFVAVMIVSLFVSMYHFTKIYTKFDVNK